jgi:hypothetical protein
MQQNASSGSTVVEHYPHHLKVEYSRPAALSLGEEKKMVVRAFEKEH